MYAQEKLILALRPAVSFALEVLAVRQPLFFKLIPYSDECFLLLHFSLEWNSLVRSSGSISEAFYSLRRDCAKSAFEANSELAALPRKSIATSLLCNVMVPYLKSKFDELYERVSGGNATRLLQGLSSNVERDEQHPRARLKSALIRLYPFLSSAYDLVHLAYNLLYLFERIQYFSPLLHMQRLIVRRLSLKEMQVTMRQPGPRDLPKSKFWRFLSSVLTGFKYGLIVGVFAFKAIEYYYRVENHSSRKSNAILKPPEPIGQSQSADAGLPRSKDDCPICRKKRTNPAACVSRPMRTLIRAYLLACSGFAAKLFAFFFSN
ncbi:hypothetical protein NDN08_007964 [Rhodosorus marinus]|uniref:Pex N-terminal domain-containing protein n=1 Tax=Rhodosorus marinus TaxID=101924 RepID=A0AAV8UZ18_9RHOD|nr:hypothetical protein NDN08_007964 [Rhodosorus marinus]